MPNSVIVILGISIIFAMTALGSAFVFFFKSVSERVNTVFLGFASGVMIAASVWSLIIPSFQYTDKIYPVVIGFILGGVFLIVLDKIIPLFYKNKKNSASKSLKLFVAVTVHNIPEGLAVGFSFGAAIMGNETALYYSALILAIGIGLQNLPEGAAISLPMQRELNNRKKAFFYGSFSGIVEPIAAVIGIVMATSLSGLMPWLLSFSAGAMLYVVADELMPETKIKNKSIGTWAFMLGFLLMMLLDVLLS